MGDYDIAISNHSNVGLFDINKLGKQKNHYIDQKKNNLRVMIWLVNCSVL